MTFLVKLLVLNIVIHETNSNIIIPSRLEKESIIVKVVIIGKTRLKLGVEVPAGVTINREELYKKYQMS